MEWTRAIDGYCERLDPSYWAEPLNAVTNLAFLIGAFVIWRRIRGAGLPLATALVVILAVIGVGSYLFHTHATVWASTVDVIPIGVFILTYLFAANRHYWQLPVWHALILTALFIPFAAATVPLFAQIPDLGSSAGYAPVPLLILIYAGLLHRRAPATARGMVLGALILIASLTFRTIDGPLCALIPVGTHFLWHLLNAVMLAWMIEVYRRHMLAAPQGAR